MWHVAGNSCLLFVIVDGTDTKATSVQLWCLVVLIQLDLICTVSILTAPLTHCLMSQWVLSSHRRWSASLLFSKVSTTHRWSRGCNCDIDKATYFQFLFVNLSLLHTGFCWLKELFEDVDATTVMDVIKEIKFHFFVFFLTVLQGLSEIRFYVDAFIHIRLCSLIYRQ